MPTLASRYYVLGTYHGNPDLKVERVNAIIGGYEVTGDVLNSTTTLKAEYRSQIQVNQNNTTQNAGNASLVSVIEDLKWKPNHFYTSKSGALVTYSQLSESNYSYPDLPNIGFYWGSIFSITPSLSFNHDLHYIGKSTAAGGAPHADYFLMNASVEYAFNETTTATLGCENLEDKRAEVIIDSPLPGRILYFNLTASF